MKLLAVIYGFGNGSTTATNAVVVEDLVGVVVIRFSNP